MVWPVWYTSLLYDVKLLRSLHHQPNCFAKIICVDGVKHIVIFAGTTIQPGEELTYDYKMTVEKRAEDRMLCGCGTSKCRGYMN